MEAFWEAGQRIFMMFNTSFSYEILDSFEDFFSLLKEKPGEAGLPIRVRILERARRVGATMRSGGAATSPLLSSRRQEAVLENDNEAVDNVEGDGFTRAGIEEMLEQFKKMVEDIEQVDEPTSSLSIVKRIVAGKFCAVGGGQFISRPPPRHFCATSQSHRREGQALREAAAEYCSSGNNGLRRARISLTSQVNDVHTRPQTQK